MDEPTYPGTPVTARLIGAIEAEQKEEGKTERNDRLRSRGVTSRATTKALIDRPVVSQPAP